MICFDILEEEEDTPYNTIHHGMFSGQAVGGFGVKYFILQHHWGVTQSDMIRGDQK